MGTADASGGRRKGPYVLETATDAERQRLAANTAIWDPFTFRRLEETGLGPGWRCLEIGAGTGTVATWLAERVGPDGVVVATDVETRWLEPLAGPNLEVRHHDVAEHPVDGGYDLIHARLVLEHLPQRATVAAKLASALRPGGFLVVDDYDLRTMDATLPPSAAWTAVYGAMLEVLRGAGMDASFGGRLPELLRSVGLVEVDADGCVRPMPMPALAPLMRPVLHRLRASVLSTGAVDADELDEADACFDDDGRSIYSPILVSARGRRPR